MRSAEGGPKCPPPSARCLGALADMQPTNRPTTGGPDEADFPAMIRELHAGMLSLDLGKGELLLLLLLCLETLHAGLIEGRVDFGRWAEVLGGSFAGRPDKLRRGPWKRLVELQAVDHDAGRGTYQLRPAAGGWLMARPRHLAGEPRSESEPELPMQGDRPLSGALNESSREDAARGELWRRVQIELERDATAEKSARGFRRKNPPGGKSGPAEKSAAAQVPGKLDCGEKAEKSAAARIEIESVPISRSIPAEDSSRLIESGIKSRGEMGGAAGARDYRAYVRERLFETIGRAEESGRCAWLWIRAVELIPERVDALVSEVRDMKRTAAFSRTSSKNPAAAWLNVATHSALEAYYGRGPEKTEKPKTKR